MTRRDAAAAAAAAPLSYLGVRPVRPLRAAAETAVVGIRATSSRHVSLPPPADAAIVCRNSSWNESAVRRTPVLERTRASACRSRRAATLSATAAVDSRVAPAVELGASAALRVRRRR